MITDDVVVERDLTARMRDGTILRADVYRPARGGPYPALVLRTPYDKAIAQTSAYAHLGLPQRTHDVRTKLGVRTLMFAQLLCHTGSAAPVLDMDRLGQAGRHRPSVLSRLAFAL